jgi:hypothetical protein
MLRPRVQLAVLALTVALPAAAHAGTYTVDACRYPSGATAPVAAWAFKTNYPRAAGISKCGVAGGYFGFGAPASAPTIARGAGGWWSLGAPAGTSISAFSTRR